MTAYKLVVGRMASAKSSDANKIYDLAIDGLVKQGHCIAVDFDGTLCSNAFPKIGKKNDTIFQYLTYLRSKGIKVILWTCREGDLLDEAVAWCKTNGLTFDAINENLPERIKYWNGDCRKIGADEYWDDRAVEIISPYIKGDEDNNGV